MDCRNQHFRVRINIAVVLAVVRVDSIITVVIADGFAVDVDVATVVVTADTAAAVELLADVILDIDGHSVHSADRSGSDVWRRREVEIHR